MKSMSVDAIVKRINRRLTGEKLIVTRGQRARLELGDYHAIDAHTGAVTAMHVDPEALAQELRHNSLRIVPLIAELLEQEQW